MIYSDSKPSDMFLHFHVYVCFGVSANHYFHISRFSGSSLRLQIFHDISVKFDSSSSDVAPFKLSD